MLGIYPAQLPNSALVFLYNENQYRLSGRDNTVHAFILRTGSYIAKCSIYFPVFFVLKQLSQKTTGAYIRKRVQQTRSDRHSASEDEEASFDYHVLLFSAGLSFLK